MQWKISFLFLIFFVLTQHLLAQTQQIDNNFIKNWLILGPYAGSNINQDYLASIGGETNANPKEGDTIRTQEGETLTWKRFQSPSNIINFLAGIGNYQNVTAYAFCDFQSVNELNLQGLIRSSDPFTIWVNGQKININSNATIHSEVFFSVNLRSGTNRCLVKVTQSSWRNMDWGFSLRFVSDVSVMTGRAVMSDAETPHISLVAQAIRNGQVMQTTLTNELGEYQFTGLKPGEYIIRFHLPNGFSYYSGHKFAVTDLSVAFRVGLLVGQRIQLEETQIPRFKLGHWKSYTALDGLADVLPTCIYRDEYGKMWIGTEGGLSYKEGGSFKSIRLQDGLPNSWIKSVFRIDRATLLIGTLSGLAEYNVKNNQVKVYKDPAVKGKVISAIRKTKGNGIVIAAQNSLYTFNGGKFVEMVSISDDLISSVCEDHKGSIWIGLRGGAGRVLKRVQEGGLYKYSYGELKRFFIKGISTFEVNEMICSQTGTIWVATNIGLLQIKEDLPIWITAKDGLVNTYLDTVFEDSSGSIWLGSRTTGGFTKFSERSVINFGIKDDLVPEHSVLMIDDIGQSPDGSLWFAAWGGQQLFTYHETDLIEYSELDGLSSSPIGGVCTFSDGTVWYIQNQDLHTLDANDVSFGISKFELDFKIFGILKQDNDVVWLQTDKHIYRCFGGSFQPVFSFPKNISLTSVSLLDEQSICLTTTNSTVEIWRDKTRIENYSLDMDRRIILIDGADIWLQAWDNNLMLLRDGQFRIYRVEDGLGASRVMTALKASDDRIWFGTWRIDDGVGGISIFDQGRFVESLTTQDGLANDVVRDIAEDEEGRMWIATLGGGVSIYDGIAWSSIDSKDGFSNESFENLVTNIGIGRNGTVWFGTGNGRLVRYQMSQVPPTSVIKTVQIGDEHYHYPEESLYIETGKRVTINCQSIDYKTHPDKHQYRYRMRIEGIDSSWLRPTKSDVFNYIFKKNGTYVFEVETIDRDLNYSVSTKLKFNVIAPWYLNGWIMIPSSGSILILLVFSVFSGYRYQVKRREAQQLRDQMLEQERRNNEALTESYEYLKQAQDQLVQTEKMASLGALTAGIAHEIRNPLNFVNNFAELSSELTQELLEELEDQKEKLDSDSLEEIEDILDSLGQNLSKIDEHGRRADSIVNGMLLHSRGVSGERSATDLNALLEEYVNLAYHGLRAQDTSFNITIERDYDESLEQISVVPQDISRVFLNILNNACYAAHQRALTAEEGFAPTLWVRTKGVSDQVQVGIKDNGTGIPEEILNKIFEPFMTTKPTGSGTGLGLSISYEIIVDEHQGQIDVDTREGEYTEFIITLPKNSEPESD